MMRLNKFNVYLDGRLLDSVFYGDGFTVDEVRQALINYDGFSPAIEVKLA